MAYSTIRSTNLGRLAQTQLTVANSSSRYSELLLKMSSKKQYLTRSENPLATNQAETLKQDNTRSTQWAANTQYAYDWTKVTDGYLQNMLQSSKDLISLATQGNSSVTQSSWAELEVEVESHLENLISCANINYMGTNLFAGQSTSDKDPITVVKDADGNITSIDQSSLDGAVSREVQTSANGDTAQYGLLAAGNPDNSIFTFWSSETGTSTVTTAGNVVTETNSVQKTITTRDYDNGTITVTDTETPPNTLMSGTITTTVKQDENGVDYNEYTETVKNADGDDVYTSVYTMDADGNKSGVKKFAGMTDDEAISFVEETKTEAGVATRTSKEYKAVNYLQAVLDFRKVLSGDLSTDEMTALKAKYLNSSDVNLTAEDMTDHELYTRISKQLTAGNQNIISKVVTNGAMQSRFENLDTTLKSGMTARTERISELVDIDMEEATVDLYNMQTSYQASLQLVSKMADFSILDYIR